MSNRLLTAWFCTNELSWFRTNRGDSYFVRIYFVSTVCTCAISTWFPFSPVFGHVLLIVQKCYKTLLLLLVVSIFTVPSHWVVMPEDDPVFLQIFTFEWIAYIKSVMYPQRWPAISCGHRPWPALQLALGTWLTALQPFQPLSWKTSTFEPSSFPHTPDFCFLYIPSEASNSCESVKRMHSVSSKPETLDYQM